MKEKQLLEEWQMFQHCNEYEEADKLEILFHKIYGEIDIEKRCEELGLIEKVKFIK